MITLPAQTLMQNRSPDWIKGRVLSLQSMMQNSAIIPIVPSVALLSDMLGLPIALNVMAITILGLGLGCVFLGETGGAHSRPLFSSATLWQFRGKLRKLSGLNGKTPQQRNDNNEPTVSSYELPTTQVTSGRTPIE
jgi:hypothetical protein